MTESSMERFKNKGKGMQQSCLACLGTCSVWEFLGQSHSSGLANFAGLRPSSVALEVPMEKRVLGCRRPPAEAGSPGGQEGAGRPAGSPEGGLVHAATAPRRPDLDRHLLLLRKGASLAASMLCSALSVNLMRFPLRRIQGPRAKV